jgi:hypothetical protein
VGRFITKTLVAKMSEMRNRMREKWSECFYPKKLWPYLSNFFGTLSWFPNTQGGGKIRPRTPHVRGSDRECSGRVFFLTGAFREHPGSDAP